MSTLAYFVGSNTAFNVCRAVRNVGRMLSDEYDLHLITTSPDAFDPTVRDDFETFGSAHQSNWTGHFASLRSYLSFNEPDLLTNVTRPSLHGNPVALAAQYHEIPYVYRYSGDAFYYYNVLQGWRKAACFGVRNVLGRLPVQLASAHIVLGPVGEQRLVDRGASRDSIYQVPTSIDPVRFEGSFSRPEGIPDDDGVNILLFVGRRTRVKGIQTMQRTIPKILKRRSDIEFVFIGDGDDLLDLSTSVREHVTVLGPVAPEAMPRYYDAADLLVHPSLSEGIPRAILESLASGTPVIARDVGDVAMATSNLFIGEREFIEGVTKFESLSLDPAKKFFIENVRNRYIKALEDIML